MLRLLVLGLLATLALGGVTPRRHNYFNERIVGGEVADAGEYPSQLSLQIYNSHVCGAFIISANWAVTGASCVINSVPSIISLVSGSLDMTNGGTRHNVGTLIMHEEYDRSTMINNIAVIEVKQPFVMSDMVQPIKLPEQDQITEAGAPATVIGWGLTSDGGSESNELKELAVEIIDQNVCIAIFGGDEVFPTNICAGSTEGNFSACHGDNGGPLIVDEIVVGLLSWTQYWCDEPGIPAVYTRMASYRDWIKENCNI